MKRHLYLFPDPGTIAGLSIGYISHHFHDRRPMKLFRIYVDATFHAENIDDAIAIAGRHVGYNPLVSEDDTDEPDDGWLGTIDIKPLDL